MKIRRLTLLALPLFLASCGPKQTAISKEAFLQTFDAMNASLKAAGTEFDNVTIKQKSLFTNDYNFKRGEFYVHRNIGLALIIPINQQEYTWKDGDKYYHAVISVLDDLTYLKTIDETSFRTYMTAHEATIMNLLSGPVQTTQDRMAEQPPSQYVSIENSFYKESGTGYTKFESSAQVIEGDGSNETPDTYSFWFDEKRPYGYNHKEGNSDTTYNFTYGEASFNPPQDERLSK